MKNFIFRVIMAFIFYISGGIVYYNCMEYLLTTNLVSCLAFTIFYGFILLAMLDYIFKQNEEENND